MKLKYLFGAMALPALVASCSNEEILVEKGDLQANRPMAGEVTLAVADGSVESRWTSAGFQAGTDIIGAALMDKFNGENETPKYSLTNEINTNYKFNYTEDGTWESDALFSEGNYFFYMQYNPEMRGRSGLYNTIPSVQEIGANGAAARYANQLFLGYYFISGGADNLDLPVAMVETYAFPRVAATYDGTNGVVIEKVVAKSPANFILERQLNVKSALTGVGAYDANENGVSDTGDVAANSKLSDYLSAFNSALQNGKAQNGVPAAVKAAVAEAMAAKAGKGASSITIVPETVAGTIDGAFVAPAGTYSDLEFDIYTNKGIVKGVQVPNITTGTTRPNTNYGYTVSDEDGTIVPANYVKVLAEKFPAALSAGEGGSSKKVEIFFKDKAITVPKTLEVASIEELTKYLTNWYTGYDLDDKTSSMGELTVTITENIVLNDAVMAFIANTTTNPTVKFTTTADKTLTIPATAAATAINTINSDATVVIAEGATQVANIGNKATGELTAKNIVNKGTLTIQATKATGVTIVGNLANMGTLNVNTALASAKDIVNGYTSKLPSLSLANNADDTAKFNAINEEAVINVSEDINATVVSYGKLNVKAEASIAKVENSKVKYALTATSAVYKTAEMTIDEDVRLYVAGENTAKITVNGVLTAVENFTNNGEIFNNYGIENKSGVQLNNNGYVTVGEDAAFTIVYDNAGTIEILDRETEVDAENNVGKILYTAESASTFTVMADDRFNTVKFNDNKTLKVEGTTTDGKFKANDEALANLKALTVEVAADGKFKFDVTDKGSIAKLIVDNNVDAIISSDVRVSKEVNIGTGASIQLNKGYKMYFDNAADGSFVNKGTFRNLGNLYAACPQPANFNQINFIGSGYKWSSFDAQTAVVLTAVTSNTVLTGTTEITNATTIADGAVIDGNGYALILPVGIDFSNITIKNAAIVSKDDLASRALPNITGKYAMVVSGKATIENCSFESPMTQYDIMIEKTATEVTITDCKFLTATADNANAQGKKVGKRAIFVETGDGSDVKLTVTGSEFADKVYAFNSNNDNLKATFTECELGGWMSGHGAYIFNECEFGKSGDYADFVPYGNATFNKCSFSSEFEISLRHTAGHTLTFIGENYKKGTTSPSSFIKWSYDGDGSLKVGSTTIVWGADTATYNSADTDKVTAAKFSWI